MRDKLSLKGVRVHNLKNVSLEIPRNALVVFTGLSGSGKSSLAFDTIYAEGQRRYVESLSVYARQFLEQLDKPDVDSIDGLSPAISIDQKSASHNPRSSVGTVTEIYDYLRLLYANIGKPFCPNCNRPIEGQSVQEMVDFLFQWPEESSLLILAPVVSEKKGEYRSYFETLKKEGFSRVRVDGEILHLETPITLSKTLKHTIEIVVDRVRLTPDNKSRLFESLEVCLKAAKGIARVEDVETGKSHVFSETMSCPDCQISFEEMSPRLFSFNSPIGACVSCKGLGEILDFDPDLIIADPRMPGKTATQKCMNLDGTTYGRMAEKVAGQFGFSLKTPLHELTEAQWNVLFYGEPSPVDSGVPLKKTLSPSYTGPFGWEGVIMNLRRRYFNTSSESMRHFFRAFMSARACPECQGKRLKKTSLAVKIGGKSISDLCDLSIDTLVRFISKLKLTEKEATISVQVLKEIRQRLSFLTNVGLDYLTLSRKSSTLSGGEFQRIRLATQIGAGLTGVLYVLDEPSIGLHQRDNQKLMKTLVNLRDLGNTLIVVEHDEDMILHADHVVDIGPGAGKDGGEILYSGDLAGLLAHETSITARFLTGRDAVLVPKSRRAPQKGQGVTVYGASENNLKSVTATFPLGLFVVVTGVSGSGKSTLVNAILHKVMLRHFDQSSDKPGRHLSVSGLDLLDKMITIDQSPIGRTPRSNPATYTGLFTPIRELFAQTREAKIKGYLPGRFSFNVKGGRCEACEGDGVLKIEMHFLSDVYVTCDVCKGKRYNTETLEVTYKGLSIADVLALAVQEAVPIFQNIPTISEKLRTLVEVGLGYIQLGQSATTLSGGEAQRIKLAKELAKRSTGKTLYLLDEPTTGLHFADIKQLLKVLHTLVDQGNTVVVIEHNLDVIKTADHVIDLGPEGGNKGGKIVATGTPEEIAEVEGSYTGQFLKGVLAKSSVII